MHRRTVLVLSLLATFLLAGCTLTGSTVEELVRSQPQVDAFLDEHPGADISVVLWRSSRLQNASEMIDERCRPAINREQDHYRVVVSEGSENITAWVEADSQTVICASRAGQDTSDEQGEPDESQNDTAGDDGDNSTEGSGEDRVMLTSDMLQDEPTLGSDDAPVTIVEYADFGCPWCTEWAGYDAIPQRPIDEENSLEQIVSNYVDSGDVRFVFKDYPLSRLHPNAPQAHRAANCILEQDEELYWEYHDLLFDSRPNWTAEGENNTVETFTDLAEEVNASVSTFEQCYPDSDGTEAQEDKDGIEQLDGSLGTPTFFIGDMEDGFLKVEGAQPYSGLKPIIDSELQD